MKNMKQNAKGFTLIELVIVIVILGILAVTAAPRFIDLSTNAQTSADQGVEGAVSGAWLLNQAANELNRNDAVDLTALSGVTSDAALLNLIGNPDRWLVGARVTTGTVSHISFVRDDDAVAGVVDGDPCVMLVVATGATNRGTYTAADTNDADQCN